MVITLDPKQAFQKDEEQAKLFRALVDSVVFKEGVHKAIAEFVLHQRPTTEELDGVRRFLDTLINLAEKPEPHQRAPFIQSIATQKPSTTK